MTIKLNLSSLGLKKEIPAPINLMDTFEQLDRKATHESLRPAQIEALTSIDQCLVDRDVILKLGTGAGKTVIGLIYAEFMRRRYPGEPVVFLCTTLQLVEQVCQSAVALGILTDQFSESNPGHSGLEGKSVLVCTYDKIFNGKSIFETRNIRPSTIIMDDVHAGIERVRSAFSAKIPDQAFIEIKELIGSACSSADFATWRGIERNEIDTRFEVPFWIYQPNAKAIFDIMQKHINLDNLIYKLPNLNTFSEHGRLNISGTSSEISFYVTPIERINSFHLAKHRLFMSASVKDGGSLIRELDCGLEALMKVVEPAADKGAGERMIIPISLVDASITKEAIAQLCKKTSKSTNVVVLCSSNKQSETWVASGATLVENRNFDATLNLLKENSKGQYLVFAQRFDGIDLADDMCRILVIDGVPKGERLSDEIDAARQRTVPSQFIRVVNKFEQALGRAVRSSADYAAVLLVGNELASFIGRKDVKRILEPLTAKQIDMGKDIAEQLAGGGHSIDGVEHAITLLLGRDTDWKNSHRSALVGIQKQTRVNGQVTIYEKIAFEERKAWLATKIRNQQDAISHLRTAIAFVDDTAYEKAELLYRMASYTNFIDPGQALEIHRSAYQLNSDLPRPVELPDKRYLKATEQAGKIRAVFSDFSTSKGAIAYIEELKTRLSYGHSASTVEDALEQLGALLGAESIRPEKETKRGPDNVWMFPEHCFCIEAKNEKTAPIFKNDAKQLILSVEWCKEQLRLPAEIICPLFATNSLSVDRKEDVTFGPLILQDELAIQLADDLKKILIAISFETPIFTDTTRLTELITEARLTPKAIRSRLVSPKI